jgi:hypothetical protein
VCLQAGSERFEGTVIELPDDIFDWYMGLDAREDEYQDRQRVRKNRRARQERKALIEAKKGKTNA